MDTQKQQEAIARAEEPRTCKCGCGSVVSSTAFYLRGHNRKQAGNPIYRLTSGEINPEWKAWYWEQNKEQITTKKRAWRYANPEKHRAYCKKAAKKDSAKQWRKTWATDRQKLRRNYWRRMVVNLLLERDGANCGVCGEPLILPITPDTTIDHIIPLCCGGTDEATNLRLAHSLCNSRRPKHL